MPYDEKLLNGFVLLQDAQGGANDDVAAPDAGQTLLYTTEQGLVAERAAGLSAANQWFLDQPVLLNGASPVALTDTPQSILDAVYTIPDDIDASFPTIYRVEVQVVVESFVQDANSIGIAVVPFVDGTQNGPAVIVACDPATGAGGTTLTFFAAGSSGEDIDVRAYLLNAADAADAYCYLGLIKRELRLSGP